MRKNIGVKLTCGLAVLLTLFSLAGCNTLNAYKEIKNDPVVMDFEVHRFKDDIICTVILETDADLVDPARKADQFREVIQQVFKDSTIVIEFIQDGENKGIY